MTDLWYCTAPFRQVYIDNNGVSPCCNFQRYQVNLDTWYSSSTLKQIQDQFLSGQKPSQCSACLKDEQSGRQSLRTENNRDYQNQIFRDTTMNFVDYRASNICNFKCRSCSPAFSNGIARETDNSQTLKKFYIPKSEKVARVDHNNFEYVIKNLDQVDRLMFTGGEPTKMPEVRAMLEEVIKRAGHRIGILITTNGSFTDAFWYDLVSKIDNLHWTLSLDAVGQAAEIIRHGTQWSVVESNARWLSKHAASFTVNTVVTNLSLLQLKPLLKFVKDLKQNSNGRNGCEHHFHVSTKPYYLAADNLSPELRKLAQSYVQHCRASGDWLESQADMLRSLDNLLAASTFSPELWAKSMEFNQTLDQIRQESHWSLFDPDRT
jgi:sulfatase maturation enzyme AslB (radical SAM superfamily)